MKEDRAELLGGQRHEIIGKKETAIFLLIGWSTTEKKILKIKKKLAEMCLFRFTFTRHEQINYFVL
jgi:hypothetical protein